MKQKISKTKIEKKLSKKLNPELKKLVITLKKNKILEVADLLLLPKRKSISVNLDKINKESKEGDNIIVPGKVLSKGEINHKINIAAFRFSEEAKNKLLKANCKISNFLEIKNGKIIK